uniref:Uncharacterized protein n=1 Tax=Ficedula albicollis TaxID=59894 RepID=A0A803VDY4_FICAL
HCVNDYQEFEQLLIYFKKLLQKRLNVRVNIELLSVSNPVHKKVCKLIVFLSFIRKSKVGF